MPPQDRRIVCKAVLREGLESIGRQKPFFSVQEHQKNGTADPSNPAVILLACGGASGLPRADSPINTGAGAGKQQLEVRTLQTRREKF